MVECRIGIQCKLNTKEDKMNHVVATSVALASVVFLAACTGNSPEDIAKDYALKFSKADMVEVEKLVTDDVKKTLKSLERICTKSEADVLLKETLIVLDKFKEEGHNEKLKEMVETNVQNFENDPKLLELQKRTISKDASQEELEKLKNEYFELLLHDALKISSGIFEILKIQTENPSDVKKVIANFMLQNGNIERPKKNYNLLKNITQDVVAERKNRVTLRCVSDYTEFGEIDKIEIIEEKKISPDQVDVRLELINDQHKSNKSTISMEKIQNEWKISKLDIKKFF